MHGDGSSIHIPGMSQQQPPAGSSQKLPSGQEKPAIPPQKAGNDVVVVLVVTVVLGRVDTVEVVVKSLAMAVVVVVSIRTQFASHLAAIGGSHSSPGSRRSLPHTCPTDSHTITTPTSRQHLVQAIRKGPMHCLFTRATSALAPRRQCARGPPLPSHVALRCEKRPCAPRTHRATRCRHSRRHCGSGSATALTSKRTLLTTLNNNPTTNARVRFAWCIIGVLVPSPDIAFAYRIAIPPSAPRRRRARRRAPPRGSTPSCDTNRRATALRRRARERYWRERRTARTTSARIGTLRGRRAPTGHRGH